MKKDAAFFERFATRITSITGSTPAFILAALVVLVWMISGPFFHFSETWQLVINTGTTIVTFLMVFLIQKSQNKDSLAVQIKLNELLAAHENASNRIVSVEDLSEEEMKILQKFYSRLSHLAKQDNVLSRSHSIDEAIENHEDKAEKVSKQKNS